MLFLNLKKKRNEEVNCKNFDFSLKKMEII